MVVHISYTIPYDDCIVAMTQYLILFYVLTLSLLSTSAPLDSNNSTTCQWPPSDALYKGVLSSNCNINNQ